MDIHLFHISGQNVSLCCRQCSLILTVSLIPFNQQLWGHLCKQMIPVPAHIILPSKRKTKHREKRGIRETEENITRKRAWGTEGAKRGERRRRAEGVNVHIINLDYLGDRAANSPGALETAGQAFAGSSQAIFTENSLTSFTSCSGAKTLVRSFKSISPSWRKSAVKCP